MEKKIKVSVIIPVYNAEKYLRKCLDSVVCQTMQEKEIICINDGSVDKSEEILEEYSNKFDFFTYYTQKNQGAGVSRNNGLKHARGKYLAFWDADDIFEPMALKVLFDAAEKETADVVVCNYRTQNVQDGNIAVYENELCRLRDSGQTVFSVEKRDIRDDIFQIFIGWPWDKLYLREFVIKNKLKFQDLRTSNDGLFVYSALLSASRITIVNEILVTHRTGDKESLENTRDKSWNCCYEMLCAVSEWMNATDCYEEYKQSFINHVLCFLVWNLDTLTKWDSYHQFYDTLKNEYLKKFELEKYDREFFYEETDYEKYRLICECSAIQYLMKLKNTIKNQNTHFSTIIRQKQWKIPYDRLTQGCKLAIYGAGEAGKDIYWQITHNKYCDISLWVDKKNRIRDSGIKVSPIDALKDGEYDYVLIAISNREIAEEVRQMLISWNIVPDKIINM